MEVAGSSENTSRIQEFYRSEGFISFERKFLEWLNLVYELIVLEEMKKNHIFNPSWSIWEGAVRCYLKKTIPKLYE